MKNREKLQQILNKTVDNKTVFGTNFLISHHGEEWQGSSGNFKDTQQYFIASTTKLFTTAIILKLKDKNLLKLDDFIHLHLDSEIMKNLHVFNGIDYSNIITIKHLLAHTSGLPDYFQGNQNNGISLEQELTNGIDKSWSFSDILSISKKMKPHFKPGEKGKAKYSDTNFQLLGKIIEKITSKSYSENCRELIFEPLNLSKTYVFSDTLDSKPKTMFFKNKELNIPKAMASFGCDGGIVSNSQEMLIFLKSFFEGKLFPKEYLEELKVWNKIFFPMQSGIGIHRFKLPWFFNPTGAVPELIGHSGLSGALAYYSEKHDLYIVGTVNQISYPEKSFKTAIKLIQKVL